MSNPQTLAGQDLITKLLACAGAKERLVMAQCRTGDKTTVNMEVVTEMIALDRCEMDAARAAETYLAVFYERYPERKP
jgi:hypothetical protein